MNKIIKLSLTLLLSACSSQSSWTPTIDPYGNPNTQQLNQDLAQCRQLAQQASAGTVQESVSGAAVGGLIGAATGAALGAISGNAGRGAASGSIGGGVRRGIRSDSSYKRAYSTCMRQRGHNTIN